MLGSDARLARALLDAVSATPAGAPLDRLVAIMQQSVDDRGGAPPSDERVRSIVSRLGLDHYLTVEDGQVRFVYEIVRLGWRARRQLWP